MNDIDTYIQVQPDWQQANLNLFRTLVRQACPEVVEAMKWNVPVFIVGRDTQFAMSAFKAHTKFNFILNGAKLTDTNTLFNNGLESAKSRGIDLKQNETIDSDKLLTLIKASLALGK